MNLIEPGKSPAGCFLQLHEKLGGLLLNLHQGEEDKVSTHPGGDAQILQLVVGWHLAQSFT